ncbi:MAG: sortase [Clostridiales bacterium]|jgi:sortase A|nr:sortase [Clostridiales bacterium]
MKNKGKGLIIIGLLLIAAALFMILYNLWEEKQAEETAMEAVARLEEMIPQTKEEPAVPPTKTEEKKESEPVQEKEKTGEKALPEKTAPEKEIEIPDYVLNPEMEMPAETVDDNSYIGVLEIPDLKLVLPVISEWSYPRLKIAPCRYMGSAYTNDLIISAHNYGSHFGKLKNLRAGDNVTFTDMDGNVFRYEVVELETLKATDVEEMESGDWDLTLFTCTVGGQNRITVRCELAAE